MAVDRKLIIKLIFFVFLAGVSGFLFFHYDLYLLFTNRERLLRFIQDYGRWSVAIFIFLQTLQVVFAPVPGELTGFIGGYLYGIFWGTLYSTVGLTLGSWIAFILARIFGLPLVEKIIKPELFKKYDHFIGHQGLWVLFLLFLIPGFPKDSLCYLIGLSHLKTVPFLIISTLGRLLGTLMLSISGNLLRNGLDYTILIPFLICLIFIAIAYFHRDRLLEKVSRRKKMGNIPHNGGKISPKQKEMK